MSFHSYEKTVKGDGMSKNEIIWVTVSTSSSREANKIGTAVLKKRLCACYSLIPRMKSVYYWPPKLGKIETSKGPLLILESFPKSYNKIVKIVKEMHADTVPFIGQWEMENVAPDFYAWMKGELT